MSEIRDFIEDNSGKNLYFCPTPLSAKKRTKENVVGSRFLWADLDEARPDKVNPRPQVAWESSPKRFAALWRLNDFHRPDKVEDVNRSLAYSSGADRSGWDLSQVLRIPGTKNYKYDNAPTGKLMWMNENAYALDEFPEHEESNEDPNELLKSIRKKLKPSTYKLLTASEATVGKRSEVIWRLENELHEQGVKKDSIFNLIKASVWNKFAGRRDEDKQLRRELNKLRDEEGDERPMLKRESADSSGSLRRMADIEAESVTWVWHPYIPRGKVTLLEGDPGLGKSWVTMAMATAISLREKLPGAEKFVGGRVLIMSAEDGLGDTVRPRLDQMGADVNKIFAYDGPVTFDDDGCEMIEEHIAELKPQMVIVDPLVAYLGGGVDLHKANETREVMSRLARIAEKHQIAILAVRHLTKGSREKSIYRGIGSIDLTAAARSVLLVGQDPQEDHSRVIVHIKSNLAPLGPAVKYELRPGFRKPFRWAGISDISADDVLNAERKSTGGGMSSYTLAKEYLQGALSGGPQLSENLRRDAEARGISIKILSRVAREMGIKRGDGKWILE